MTIYKYQIIAANSIVDLEQAVNKLMNQDENWKPIGGVAIYEIEYDDGTKIVDYHQAMVKSQMPSP